MTFFYFRQANFIKLELTLIGVQVIREQIDQLKLEIEILIKILFQIRTNIFCQIITLLDKIFKITKILFFLLNKGRGFTKTNLAH